MQKSVHVWKSLLQQNCPLRRMVQWGGKRGLNLFHDWTVRNGLQWAVEKGGVILHKDEPRLWLSLQGEKVKQKTRLSIWGVFLQYGKFSDKRTWQRITEASTRLASIMKCSKHFSVLNLNTECIWSSWNPEQWEAKAVQNLQTRLVTAVPMADTNNDSRLQAIREPEEWDRLFPSIIARNFNAEPATKWSRVEGTVPQMKQSAVIARTKKPWLALPSTAHVRIDWKFFSGRFPYRRILYDYMNEDGREDRWKNPIRRLMC